MNSEMLRRLLTYIDDHICEKISLVEMVLTPALTGKCIEEATEKQTANGSGNKNG